jgi:hypothetical protein
VTVREVDDGDDPRRAELRRLTVALADMAAARSLADLLLERRHGAALEIGLMTGLVVSYARPFSASNHIGRLGGRWERFPDQPPFKAWHIQLQGLRDRVYAHTDRTLLREVHVLPASAWDHDGTTVFGEMPWAFEAFADFRRLIDFQEKRLRARVTELVQELYPDDYAPGTMIHLRWPGDEDLLRTVSE